MGPPGPGARTEGVPAATGSYTRMIRALARGGACTLFQLGVLPVVSSRPSSFRLLAFTTGGKKKDSNYSRAKLRLQHT